MFVLTSATVSHDVSIYISEVIFAAFIQFVNLGNLVLVVLSIPDEWVSALHTRLALWIGKPGLDVESRGLHSDRFVWWAALWVTGLSAFLALIVYQNHPHVQDEVAYLLQARYLANNKLTMPSPPVPPAFDFYLMQFDGNRWYPSAPAGWPALLSIGVRMGVPWLVNPVLAGINLVLIYIILMALYSRRIARIAIFLLCLSPWYVFMGMNFMTHMFTLTCALAATLWIMRARETGKAYWAIWSGLALGIMSLIRPVDGLIMAALLGLWAIGFGGRRVKFLTIAALISTTGLVSLLVLPYNYVLTGNPIVFPINAYTDQRFGVNSNAFGFGPDRGMGWAIDPNPGHSPLDGLINANLNTFSINIELFGWSIGSLLLIAVFFFSFRFQKTDFLMLALMFTVFAVFFFYYFSGGPDFGARYWFLMIVPLVVLTVRGIQILEEKVIATSSDAEFQKSRVLAGVMLCSLLTLITFFPWRAVDKYYHYLGMRPDILSLAKEHNFGRSLVLVRGDDHPDYSSAAIYNPLDVYSDGTIYAWDRSPEVRDAVIQAYADRPIWLVDGPTITLDGYRLIAGPLSAHDLIAGNQTKP